MKKLKEARERLSQLVRTLREAADTYEALPDDATDEQRSTADKAFEDARGAIADQRAIVERLEKIQEAREANPAPDDPVDPEPGEPRSRITVGSEPLEYEKRKLDSSFLLDIARVEIGRGDVAGARKRLERHGSQMKVEVEARRARHERAMRSELDDLLKDLPDHIAERVAAHGLIARARRPEVRDLGRFEGKGGDFVPPLWMLDEYAEFARAGRPFANALRNIPLPGGTDSIRVPRIKSGASAKSQAADLDTVTEVDMETATVVAPVRTIAGQQDLPLQLLDQSPIGWDQILFPDLAGSYNEELDRQCIGGIGANGELLGLLNTAGVNTVSYTDGTPTLPELWPKIGDALNQASLTRKLTATHLWMHTRRWYWAAAQLDGTSKPFLTPIANGPQNAIGVYDETLAQGGPITAFYTTNAWLDLNIPTNLGAGTNEDRIAATRMADHVLFEGDVNTRVLMEVLSDKLGVRLQLWAYCAFTAGRFPAATTVISGTGLVTPTF